MDIATRRSFDLFVRRLRQACRAAFVAASERRARESEAGDDVRLFLTTFAGGFLFMSLMLA